MKKTASLFLALALALSLAQHSPADAAAGGNYTDEMKIPYTVDLSEEDGADSVERQGDHADSPYFSRLDFYNMSSTDTLAILPKFKTQQQTSEWSCGVSSALMVMNYYGLLGENNEQTLSALRSVGLTSGKGGETPGSTSLLQMIDMFKGVGGYELTSSFDYEPDQLADAISLSAIRGYIQAGTPVMIGWNDWGGHWQVVIGYDTMGTETEQDDVLIVADPYDTTDHNQDGYGVYPAERFYYNFTFYNFFNDEDGNDMRFLVAKPAA
ncbi:MAG: hypothetical protein GX558_12700 [Clostridiales bacterium]|nr:hypothetical protein [Clostridiales bacterium]